MGVSESSKRKRFGNSVPPTLVNVPPTLVKLCEVNLEVRRVIEQAKLGHLLRERTVRSWKVSRCKGRSFNKTWSLVNRSDRESGTRGIPMGTITDCFPAGLQKHKKRWVTKLTDVIMVPCWGKQAGIGTLEAHLNAFIYSTAGRSEVFMHDDVEVFLYRMPNLLMFYMKHFITVGNKETKLVQFRVRDLTQDLKKFIQEVQVTQYTCGSKMPFTPVVFQGLEDFMFRVFHERKPAYVSMTLSALLITEEVFIVEVVLLRDILFVNLACLEHGEIKTTLVFKDPERDVRDFTVMSREVLTGIKDRLNKAGIKYFVNRFKPNWSKLKNEAIECPEKFIIDNGGWEFLEDSLTLAYYPPRVDSYSYLDLKKARSDIYI